MHYFTFPLREITNNFIDNWMLPVLGPFFDQISYYLGLVLDAITNLLIWLPPELIAVGIIFIAWRLKGIGFALFTLIGLIYIGSVDLWIEAIQTLAIILNATIFSIIVGIPLGIWSARSDRADSVIRPILDFMQTLPPFVYLIPTILLFGLGGVPAVIATFVFSTPPAVRLTNLGIRQVPEDVVEAAKAFGSTPRQMLLKVQLPIAMPAIMAGINQTIMLALSMAVIAAMIGSPGLGSTVLAGISQVDVGLGLTGGLGIVVLAILLDRITEGLSNKQKV